MVPQPIEKIFSPAYPTRREFLAKSTVVLLTMGLGGCGKINAHPIVAPIFEHGEGRGADGCVVINPPVFLSEEEAMQVIKEELSKEGIQLGSGIPLPEVAKIDIYLQPEKWLGDPDIKKFNQRDNAVLGAVDWKQKVGVEYVSREDQFYSLKDLEEAGTVSEYKTKKWAEDLAHSIAQKATVDLRIGIFYDPLVGEKTKLDDADYQKEKKLIKEAKAKLSKEEREKIDRAKPLFEKIFPTNTIKSRALLRKQSQDFVAWLKKQE